MAYQSVFDRFEKKYRLTRESYEKVRKALAPYFQEDQYGLSTICSLYYDTEQYDLIRTSIEKPVYKEKLRLRSYGVPGENDPVFLEIKKKFSGVVNKRRTSLPLADARAFLAGERPPCLDREDHEDQIQKEIDFFIRRCTPVPKIMICYDRIALYGVQDAALRVTFDFNIRWRADDLDLAMGDRGELLLPEGECLMELKIPGGAIPLYLSRLLSELSIFPSSFSKYGSCYELYLNPFTTGGHPHVCQHSL